MVYNLTNLTNAGNFYEIVEVINIESSFVFSMFLLFTIFIILFIALKRFESDTTAVLMVSSLIVSIISVLLWSINFITWGILIIPIVAFLGFALMYKIHS